MPLTLSSPLVRRLVGALSGAVAVGVIAVPALAPSLSSRLASAADREPTTMSAARSPAHQSSAPQRVAS